MSLLQKDIVLEVNRNWLATDWITVGEAMLKLCRDSCRVLPVRVMPDGSPEFGDFISWEKWLRRPIKSTDQVIRAATQNVAIPHVIIDCESAYMPKEVLPLGLRGIYIRDKGIDQYTGLPVAWEDATMDHIQPISRDGDTSWLNLVLAHRETNQLKRDRTPEEAGLKLIRKPYIPAPMAKYALLTNHHNIPECSYFLQAKV